MRPPIAHASAQAAEDAFYDAMQQGDLEAMMALWADDEDAVCVHPSGARLVGLAAIRKAFEQIFAQGGVDVRVAATQTHQGVMVAVHNLVEKVLVTGRAGSEVVECVATNVYVKGAGGWRILMHHASPLGEAASPEVGPPPSSLH